MSTYHAERRVVIGPLGVTEATKAPGIAIHEDQGDGVAACAVGTQMGKTKSFMEGDDWRPLGPGQVDCLLCGERNDPTRRSGGRPKARKDSTSESLDDRIARLRAKREADA